MNAVVEKEAVWYILCKERNIANRLDKKGIKRLP